MANTRYIRQTLLPELGKIGQQKLLNASVLCVGAGGLGCASLPYLAGAGIGHIGIIDDDVVDETNLHRQTLYTMDDIAAPKAIVAKSRLEALNPAIKITPYTDKLSAINGQNLCAQYDIIIDGSDNFETKYLINDICVKLDKPFLHASVLKFEGHIAVFDTGRDNAACYRCLFAHAPKTHTLNCAQAGVIGAAVGIIGTMQAMEAIKIIVNHPTFAPLYNTLLTLDTRDMHMRRLAISKDPNCAVCAKAKKDIKIMDTIKTITCGVVPEISPTTIKTMDAPVLIDVREADEWAAGHIKGAHHLALSDLLEKRKSPTDLDLKTDQNIILYCRSGKRSLNAAHIFINHGYTNVHNMTGGILAW